MITGKSLFSKFHFVIKGIAFIFKIFGKNGNLFFLLIFRNFPGYTGLFLRYIFLKNSIKKIGTNVSVHPGVYFKNIKAMEIGNDVSIHPMCYFEAGGGIKIGNEVSIAHNASFLSYNHDWKNESLPIKYNLLVPGKIEIKDDVWIGCGVRVLAGTTIHSRSIIAAGAVVNKNVKSHTIVGGIPARVIKDINS